MVEGPGVDAPAQIAALVGPLAVLTAAVDEVFAACMASLSAAELMEFLRGWESHRRREEALSNRLVAEVMTRGIAGELGYSSPQALLAGVLRVDPGEAKARVRAAADLAPRVGLTGERLPPVFAETAAAQEAGSISAGHARVIVSTLDGLSAELDFDRGSQLQSQLVAAADVFAPHELAKLATRIVAHLDPDCVEPRDARQERQRAFTLAKRADGMVVATGALTPACGAALESVLDSLSAPAPAGEGPDGVVEPDRRTAAQRRHDALLDASLRLLADGGLPKGGGVASTLLITMTEEQFRTQRGYATTSHGDLISVRQSMTLAEEADVVTVVLNAAGGVVSHGRTRRLASPAQRHALYARDGGCSFPQCTVPVQWTQVHHHIPWQRGGETALHNMALVCGHHHRAFEKLGWTLSMADGAPWWIPPPWIDPRQTPLRNTHHAPATAPV
ncbi:protein of unknown function [Frankineae bacterium MT45]|nr:protein of unknown function [Frankineae bacterium MT45]